MKITVLKSKIHTARVTGANLEYKDSIVIDETIMKAVELVEYEKVLVANFTNGNRYETYVIKRAVNSGIISVNGGGARYSCVGDTITIFAFINLEVGEKFQPNIIILDENNSIKKVK